jgi:hypothetical protein
MSEEEDASPMGSPTEEMRSVQVVCHSPAVARSSHRPSRSRSRSRDRESQDPVGPRGSHAPVRAPSRGGTPSPAPLQSEGVEERLRAVEGKVARIMSGLRKLREVLDDGIIHEI